MTAHNRSSVEGQPTHEAMLDILGHRGNANKASQMFQWITVSLRPAWATLLSAKIQASLAYEVRPYLRPTVSKLTN